jgi:hypothetical protein
MEMVEDEYGGGVGSWLGAALELAEAETDADGVPLGFEDADERLEGGLGVGVAVGNGLPHGSSVGEPFSVATPRNDAAQTPPASTNARDSAPKAVQTPRRVLPPLIVAPPGSPRP